MSVYFQNAQDVSEYNVLSMLHELMHRTKYELPEPEAESKAEKEKPQQATLTGEQKREMFCSRCHFVSQASLVCKDVLLYAYKGTSG